MRPALILGTNLVLGTALLGWVLHRFGAPALEILTAGPALPLLAGFVGVAAACVLALTARWRALLTGLGATTTLVPLALYRSAAHSIATLVPSGRAGGDPLRAWLANRDGVAGSEAIASVAMDRSLELAATIPFSLLFATLLVQEGIPYLGRAQLAVAAGAVGLTAGLWLAAYRLRRGAGLVTPLMRRMRLDRLQRLGDPLALVQASEAAAARLVDQPLRLLGALLAGLVANLLVVAEFALLLAAFGLPADPIAVVAAVFATGASHWLPVPAGVGVLEGAQIWIFGMLGHPTEVGLAVGLAVRLRELVWMLPGITYLMMRSLGSSLARLRAARSGV